MLFQQLQPSDELSNIIKSYWFADSENDYTIRNEKIVPDGYPEIIFHYKEPYKIYIDGKNNRNYKAFTDY